jgi:hypothetical protein
LLQREKREVEFLLQLFDGFNSNEIKALISGISKLGENIVQMTGLYNHEEKE